MICFATFKAVFRIWLGELAPAIFSAHPHLRGIYINGQQTDISRFPFPVSRSPHLQLFHVSGFLKFGLRPGPDVEAEGRSGLGFDDESVNLKARRLRAISLLAGNDVVVGIELVNRHRPVADGCRGSAVAVVLPRSASMPPDDAVRRARNLERQPDTRDYRKPFRGRKGIFDGEVAVATLRHNEIGEAAVWQRACFRCLLPDSALLVYLPSAIVVRRRTPEVQVERLIRLRQGYGGQGS